MLNEASRKLIKVYGRIEFACPKVCFAVRSEFLEACVGVLGLHDAFKKDNVKSGFQ